MRIALLGLLLAPSAAADVRVVSPTGPYTQIQAAVSAANEGDLVLVHAGTYRGFSVSAKSLTIAANNTGTVNVQGAVRVQALAAGQTLCLIGLHAVGFASSIPNSRFGLYANQNQGSLRCENCQFVGLWDVPGALNGADGAWVGSSDDVSFVRCSLAGGLGNWGSGSNIGTGGAGLRSIASMITLFDSALLGGVGEDATCGTCDSGNGGQGLHAELSTLFASHSSCEGGDGGYGGSAWGPYPGYGGFGVFLDTASLMHVIDCSFQGGADGDYQYPGYAPPTYGGTFDNSSGTRRVMTSANPVRELTTLSLSFHGAAGESVYLLDGAQTGLQWDPARFGNFLIQPPNYRTLFVGTTDGSGNLNVGLPLPDLGAGVQSRMRFLQPLFQNAAGAQQLGTPICLAELDAAF